MQVVTLREAARLLRVPPEVLLGALCRLSAANQFTLPPSLLDISVNEREVRAAARFCHRAVNSEFNGAIEAEYF